MEFTIKSTWLGNVKDVWPPGERSYGNYDPDNDDSAAREVEAGTDGNTYGLYNWGFLGSMEIYDENNLRVLDSDKAIEGGPSDDSDSPDFELVIKAVDLDEDTADKIIQLAARIRNNPVGSVLTGNEYVDSLRHMNIPPGAITQALLAEGAYVEWEIESRNIIRA